MKCLGGEDAHVGVDGVDWRIGGIGKGGREDSSCLVRMATWD